MVTPWGGASTASTSAASICEIVTNALPITGMQPCGSLCTEPFRASARTVCPRSLRRGIRRLPTYPVPPVTKTCAIYRRRPRRVGRFLATARLDRATCAGRLAARVAFFFALARGALFECFATFADLRAGLLLCFLTAGLAVRDLGAALVTCFFFGATRRVRAAGFALVLGGSAGSGLGDSSAVISTSVVISCAFWEDSVDPSSPQPWASRTAIMAERISFQVPGSLITAFGNMQPS